MELIEGAPLYEHFNSLKEKGERFSEERIWNIFIQIVLALRYLHKDKKIVHRDLTPNNIMLGENDKVTISKSSERFTTWDGVTFGRNFVELSTKLGTGQSTFCSLQ